MKKILILIAMMSLLASCSSLSPKPVTTVNKTVSEVAEQWLRCPPPNPRRPDLCKKACCGNGSNWFVSCITFVGEISREALGHVDPDLLKGYSKHPGKTYGSPMKAWQALVASGRARYDLSKIEEGSAIFYKIPTFPAGHVAIATGEKDADGEYLVITSGGYRRKDMRKEKISEEVRAVSAQILGWAKIL
jgi:hypothetical protein